MEPLLAAFPDFETLSVVTVLSRTGRSCVLLTLDLNTLEESVVKIGPKDGFLRNEINCLKSVKHPNIVQLQSVSFSSCGQLVALKFEKVKGEALVKYIIEKGRLSERETTIILNQLISVLEYIHGKGWIHQDLKPDNIMFDPRDQKITLIDFEFSCQWSKWRYTTSDLGTYEYSSPEIRSRKRFTGPEVDLWSLGITLFVMLSGSFPFSKEDLYLRRETWLNFSWPLFVGSKWQRIISKLSDPDPRQRISLSQLKVQISIGGSSGLVGIPNEKENRSRSVTQYF